MFENGDILINTYSGDVYQFIRYLSDGRLRVYNIRGSYSCYVSNTTVRLMTKLEQVLK